MKSQAFFPTVIVFPFPYLKESILLQKKVDPFISTDLYVLVRVSNVTMKESEVPGFYLYLNK